jgi:AcrR family transcriptional regulator
MPRKALHDRDDLIKRAKDIFWRRGWAGTSLKDLEVALDTRPGSFYAAFGSKDALYELALNKYAQDGMDRLEALNETQGSLGALQAYPGIVFENPDSAGHACMLAKTFLELNGQGHALAQVANDLLLRMEAKFAQLFQAAQAAGEIGPTLNTESLAGRYQSDLLGLQVLAAQSHSQAQSIAQNMAEELGRLKGHA